MIDIQDGKFSTYEGDYQYFLESNEEAAEKEERFAAKEAEISKSNIKVRQAYIRKMLHRVSVDRMAAGATVVPAVFRRLSQPLLCQGSSKRI